MSQEWEDILALAEDYNPTSPVYISPVSLAIFGYSLRWLQSKWAWVGKGEALDDISDSEWDEIEAAVAKLTREIWSNMIGHIQMVATEEVPDNMLLCDGTTYAREDYPELYEAIAGSCHIDADNFFVPDLRLPRLPGYTDVSSVGQQNSDDWSVFIFENNMPTHSHEITIIDPSHTHADLGDVITAAGLIGEIPAPVTYQSPAEIVPALTGITATAGNTGGSEALELPDIPITGIRYAIVAR